MHFRRLLNHIVLFNSVVTCRRLKDLRLLIYLMGDATLCVNYKTIQITPSLIRLTVMFIQLTCTKPYLCSDPWSIPKLSSSTHTKQS